jgi:hypothetical protein
VSRFDFLPPNDPYKMLFATGTSPMAAFYRPLSPRGALAAFAFSRLRPLVKDFLQAATKFGLSLESAVERMQRTGVALARCQTREKFPNRSPGV